MLGLDEAQAGIKIAGRNINHLRYADDTTLTAESEELKSLLMKVKEKSGKVGLTLNTQKTEIMASSPHPLLSPFSPAFSLSQHQGLFRESVLCIRWPKYWSFSISPSIEYSGLISFRIDWLDLLAV